MKPILFNTDMVRAILEGRKTVTRRVVKPQPPGGVQRLYQKDGSNVWRSPGEDAWVEIRAPYQTGDVLWVRETWAKSMAGTFMYRADDKAIMVERWHPSIHMPQEVARIFLRVTGVRVERLQEIDDRGVVAEGLEIGCYFDDLWNRTVKPTDRAAYGWEANPWVWVIEFERISKEEIHQ